MRHERFFAQELRVMRGAALTKDTVAVADSEQAMPRARVVRR